MTLAYMMAQTAAYMTAQTIERIPIMLRANADGLRIPTVRKNQCPTAAHAAIAGRIPMTRRRIAHMKSCRKHLQRIPTARGRIGCLTIEGGSICREFPRREEESPQIEHK
ncbi:MAG: hypothetical protein SPF30_03495 [Arcanobacterium sp.]|nr:hypothetical protein [Arcanobacterium sp.]